MDDLFSYGELDVDKLHEALSLIHDVFLEFVAPECSDEGIAEFLRFIEPFAIIKMLADNKMRIWTCEIKGEIIGVLAAGRNHIYLMFVNSSYHRKGIARRLVNMMIKSYDPLAITVNSSPFALEAYRNLGFVDTGTQQTSNGLRFIPMKMIL